MRSTSRSAMPSASVRDAQRPVRRRPVEARDVVAGDDGEVLAQLVRHHLPGGTDRAQQGQGDGGGTGADLDDQVPGAMSPHRSSGPTSFG